MVIGWGVGFVVGLLAVAAVFAWLKGRAAGRAEEKQRSDGLAVEAQKRQAEQAKAEERAEVDAAVAKRDAEKKRPGVDRANERLRRIVPILILALAMPARAECRVEGPDTVCPTPEFDQLMDQLDNAEAQVAIEKAESRRLDKELAAARDRAAVTHPEPRAPVLEVVAGSSIALVLGVVLGFLLGSAR